MAVIIQAYKCDYCNMCSVHKSSVVRHEKQWCRSHNHCNVCQHYREDFKTVDVQPHPNSIEKKVMWCQAKNINLLEKIKGCDEFVKEIFSTPATL